MDVCLRTYLTMSMTEMRREEEEKADACRLVELKTNAAMSIGHHAMTTSTLQASPVYDS